jgi:hypothetical protein
MRFVTVEKVFYVQERFETSRKILRLKRVFKRQVTLEKFCKYLESSYVGVRFAPSKFVTVCTREQCACFIIGVALSRTYSFLTAIGAGVCQVLAGVGTRRVVPGRAYGVGGLPLVVRSGGWASQRRVNAA